MILTAGAAFSQPYGAFLTNPATGHGYIQLPNTSVLNFAGGSFTFEAWVAAADTGPCVSLAGNKYTTSQWIGICGTSLRSYMAGSGSQYTIGTVPAGNWTHIAVVFDGATKKHSHYVDGELAGERVEAGAMTSSTDAWRIYSDSAWEHTPNGAIDDVRFWNVARTQAQIRSTINQKITSAPGLVATYALDSNATDSTGTAHGTKLGTANYFTSAVALGCTTSTNQLCVGSGGRFSIVATYKVDETSGIGNVVPFQTSESGMFTFFSPTNWEVVGKVLNGCGLNSKYWFFAAGLTDVHVEFEVTDVTRGVTKRYFNYSGTPFAPINDVDALATCP